MRFRTLAMAGFFMFPVTAMAVASLSVDTSYLYSRNDYQSTTSSFSLLSKAGYSNRVQLTLGAKKLDLVASAQVDQFNYNTSSLRTVDQLKPMSMTYNGGLRLNTKYFCLSLLSERKDALYLIENSTVNFSTKKAALNFGVVSVKVFGWGMGYRVSMDAEFGLPLSTADTEIGKLQYTNFARGTARVEFGQQVRIGFVAGIGNEDYSLGTSKYSRFDFRSGITLVFSSGRDKNDPASITESQMFPSGSGNTSGSSGNYPYY